MNQSLLNNTNFVSPDKAHLLLDSANLTSINLNSASKEVFKDNQAEPYRSSTDDIRPKKVSNSSGYTLNNNDFRKLSNLMEAHLKQIIKDQFNNNNNNFTSNVNNTVICNNINNDNIIDPSTLVNNNFPSNILNNTYTNTNITNNIDDVNMSNNNIYNNDNNVPSTLVNSSFPSNILNNTYANTNIINNIDDINMSNNNINNNDNNVSSNMDVQTSGVPSLMGNDSNFNNNNPIIQSQFVNASALIHNSMYNNISNSSSDPSSFERNNNINNQGIFNNNINIPGTSSDIINTNNNFSIPGRLITTLHNIFAEKEQLIKDLNICKKQHKELLKHKQEGTFPNNINNMFFNIFPIFTKVLPTINNDQLIADNNITINSYKANILLDTISFKEKEIIYLENYLLSFDAEGIAFKMESHIPKSNNDIITSAWNQIRNQINTMILKHLEKENYLNIHRSMNDQLKVNNNKFNENVIRKEEINELFSSIVINNNNDQLDKTIHTFSKIFNAINNNNKNIKNKVRFNNNNYNKFNNSSNKSNQNNQNHRYNNQKSLSRRDNNRRSSSRSRSKSPNSRSLSPSRRSYYKTNLQQNSRSNSPSPSRNHNTSSFLKNKNKNIYRNNFNFNNSSKRHFNSNQRHNSSSPNNKNKNNYFNNLNNYDDNNIYNNNKNYTKFNTHLNANSPVRRGRSPHRSNSHGLIN